MRIGSAQLQHHCARVIRTRIRGRFGTIGGYAAAIGMPTERVGRMLRGEILMRFEDVVQAELYLGQGIMRAGIEEYEREIGARTVPGPHGR